MGPAGTCYLRAGPALGGGVFGGCQAQRFRLLVVAAAMLHALYFLLSLLLLAIPAPTHAWSRPLWYQVGLDLQPWGCQPNSLDSCRSSLGCPGSWVGLGGNRIYPVAGVTITTTMMLVISRAMLQRWRSQVTKGKAHRSHELLAYRRPSGIYHQSTGDHLFLRTLETADSNFRSCPTPWGPSHAGCPPDPY
ncbi:transmembrane protein 89 isoform X1 [Sciurus carolinensis]|uniref:transmembrane protein 89 isoform X1 n=1 Tax=Sciurus carolinensis TaxID=30640 RepID=UPI001FB37883|nr:transmembrane protein 89 isoform X1 [Sciurus carolinensis]